MHKLHFGDNLLFMEGMADQSVDLIYLDPPFNSKKIYNVIVPNGQVKAFDDTWSWDYDDMRVYQTLLERGDKVSKWAEGMFKILGSCGMLSYLLFMAERLIECKRVMKDTSSIWLHCDPTASHHLRVLLDAIFMPESFKNEIIWHYSAGGVSKRHFARKHDVILFYAQPNHISTIPKELGNTKYNLIDEDGRAYYRKIERSTGKEYRYYQDEGGRIMHDVWDDIPSFRSPYAYPTQKPEALLERIIKASSNPGDVVFDPFVGSGTTVVVAAKLGRIGIGCDLTYLAIDIAEERLTAAGFEVEISGEPQTFKQEE